MERDPDRGARGVEQVGDLGIAISLEVAQGEDLGGPWRERRDGVSQLAAQLAALEVRIGSGERIGLERDFRLSLGVALQRHLHRAFARPQQVEPGVHRRAVQVARRRRRQVRRLVAAQEAQEDRLEHVLGIARVAGQPVGDAEDPPGVLPEQSGQNLGFRGRRWGHFGCENLLHGLSCRSSSSDMTAGRTAD